MELDGIVQTRELLFREEESGGIMLNFLYAKTITVAWEATEEKSLR